MNDSISLSKLVSDVKITLQNNFELPVWVVAEISEMNINRSGHCYLELVEKDSISDKIIAKSRATIWAFAFRMIKPYFETTTGASLKAGLKVLIRVSIEFHEVFGFSLNVQDIDPQYTLGDLARKKTLIIQQLEDEGVLEMNKSLELPLVPQRVAVISSETAAGYGDFCDQLSENTFGFAFHTKLFPAIMQGEKAAESIIGCLDRIFDQVNDFDIVAIIRGGGSKSDLSCFDSYDLAYYITQFPLPVITGIGHERDDTITDLVANTKLKTPTALAEFLINKALDFYNQLNDYSYRLREGVEYLLDKEKKRLENNSRSINLSANSTIQINSERIALSKTRFVDVINQSFIKRENTLSNHTQKIKILSQGLISREIQMCDIQTKRLRKWTNNYLSRKDFYLNSLESKVELIKPQNILKRGYAMITHQDKIITDSKMVNVGDVIEIKLNKGFIEGEVKSKN